MRKRKFQYTGKELTQDEFVDSLEDLRQEPTKRAPEPVMAPQPPPPSSKLTGWMSKCDGGPSPEVQPRALLEAITLP
jgi:hypothetical protein